MSEARRFKAVEYAPPAPLAEEISTGSGITVDGATTLLAAAGSRVGRTLGLEANPVFWKDGRVQFQNVAGILLLASRLELEVAPKFLGSAPGWREDFFMLATLSSHGRLLDNDGLASSARKTSDLSTLIGRALVEMYNRNRRRPLRSYRRLRHTSFSLEGDFDPAQLSFPSDDGYDQEVTRFTDRNAHNAVIRAAATKLASVVPDVETRTRLERVAQQLPIRSPPARLHKRRLPSRGRHWQSTYDLAVDVLRGYGGAFDPQNLFSPGFVVSTWQIWECLVATCLRLRFGAQGVFVQKRYPLGRRRSEGGWSPMHVIPDSLVIIETEDGRRRLVVDAKYKTNIRYRRPQVLNADVYEALAFSKATGTGEVVLVYPMALDGKGVESGAVGGASEFTRIEVGETRIRAIEVGVRGVSQANGLRILANALHSEVLKP